jgi:polysaccharide deacetylase 2 family uncharacterized protein YibQ
MVHSDGAAQFREPSSRARSDETVACDQEDSARSQVWEHQRIIASGNIAANDGPAISSQKGPFSSPGHRLAGSPARTQFTLDNAAHIRGSPFELRCALLNYSPIRTVASVRLDLKWFSKPRFCLILDDLGLDEANDFRALTLPHGVTFSILPRAAHARKLAEAARELGHEVFLHMPMQPRGDADPGPGALRLDLSPEENVARLISALEVVGPVVGVNNHMGSAFTESEDALRPVMKVLSERRLTFVDSRTSSNSCAFQIARSCGVRAMENGAFLDDDSDESYLPAQMEIAAQKSRQRGFAIGIAHAHAATIRTLPACFRQLEEYGVVLSTIGDTMGARKYR